MHPSNQSTTEGRLCLAIQAYAQGKIRSLRAAARSYNVPYATLNTRYHGIPSRRDSWPAACKLTSNKEEVLLQHILNLNT